MSTWRIACLGPELTHSHLALVDQFPNCTHVTCDSLSDCVNAVACEKADYAFVPFHNTSALNIAASQLALIEHAGRLKVLGVAAIPIQHCVGGFGSLADTKVIRSIKPALHQIRQWIKRNGISVELDETSPSTSAAVKSLLVTKPPEVAVVAAKKAFDAHHVPIYEENIQDEHNTTLFFLVGRQGEFFDKNKEDVQVLVACRELGVEPDPEAVQAHGMIITESWVLSSAVQSAAKYQIFSLAGLRVGVDIEAGTKQFIKATDAILLGTYPGPTTVQLKNKRDIGYFGWLKP